MRNVWRQTGLWKYLSEERPAQWTQGPVPAGGGSDPTLPAADPLKKACKTAWQRAAAERNSAAEVIVKAITGNCECHSVHAPLSRQSREVAESSLSCCIPSSESHTHSYNAA
eukprot:1816183-Rhodomonas_salina.1